PGSMSARDHLEIGAAHHRVQIGSGNRTALALPAVAPELGNLIKPRPFLIGAIEIVVAADLDFAGGIDKGTTDRARASLLGDLQQSCIAMKRVGAANVVFGPAKHGQHIRPSPAVAS